MGGEGASWLGALADRFPETPAPLLHLALHYYRNELDPGSDRAASLPWIPKLLPPRRPPLPVLARRPFEAHPSPRSLTDDDPVPLPPFLSSKCHTPYLQLLETLQDDLDADVDVDVDALRGLLEAAMGALFARPTNRWVDLTPHRNRCSLADPPAGHAPAANSIAADDLPSLCDAVFEAYVETCDAAELCARMKDVCGDAGSSVRREELLEALEDYEMDVSARAARLQTTMDLVATVAVSVMSVMSVTSDPSSTDLTRALAQWSEGWHAVVDALRPVAAAYMTPALVVPVVCKSALDGLRSACATGSLLSLSLSSDLAARLGDVKQQLGLVLPEEQYRAEKIHGVHHNAGAVLSVMRFESRMEVFSKLVDCVSDLETVVDELRDILRSHADFVRVNHVLDPDKVDVVARHLQETDVRLYDAELRAMWLVEAHVDGLASFKRGVHVSTLVGGSKAMRAALVRRGVSRVAAARDAMTAAMTTAKPEFSSSRHTVPNGKRALLAGKQQQPRYYHRYNRNRHLASLAADLVAFHRNEETEAVADALLRELDEENARVAAAIDRACDAALGTLVADALSSRNRFRAISDVWLSRKDTSLHWVLTRHQRLRACASVIGEHLPAVDAELPAAAAAFRAELAAVSAVGAKSTIASACVDEILDRYGEVAGRIEGLSESLARNLERVDEFCREWRGVGLGLGLGLGLDGVATASAASTANATTVADVSAALAGDALLCSLREAVERFVPARDAIVGELVAELVDVGDDSYRSRLEARTRDAMAGAVVDAVCQFAKDVFDVVPEDADDDGVQPHVTFVLSVPTFEDLGPAACELLSRIAGTAADLVSRIDGASIAGTRIQEDIDAILAYGTSIAGLERDSLVAVPPAESADDIVMDCAGDRRAPRASAHPVHLRLSRRLVVACESDDQIGLVPAADAGLSATSTAGDAVALRIEAFQAESARLRDDIMGHLRSSKEEFAPYVTTVVSEMRERAWLLDATADRIRYDLDVMAINQGDVSHHQWFQLDTSDGVFSPTVASDGGGGASRPPPTHHHNHHSMIRSLAAKVLETERELLHDVRDMEARAAALQSDMDWIRDAPSYSAIDLEVKLNELGVTLDDCADRARSGAGLVDALSGLAAAFGGLGSVDTLAPIRTIAATSATLRELNGHLESFSGLVDRFRGVTWDECRQDIADVLRTAADHQSHVQTFGKSAGSWAMFQEYSDTVSHSTDALELINAVCAAPLQERHWAKLGSLCDLSGNLSNHLSNQSSPARLWSAIVNRADGGTKTAEVEDLLALAIREGKLRSTFDAIKSQWTTATIQLGPYKSKGDIFLESSTAADVMDGLEDAIMTLGSMASNRASHHFRDEIKEFLKLLSNIEESMQLWLSTQSVWSYMEAVFDGGDIAAQLPDEAARFSGIDARYLDIVREAKQVPLFAEFFRGDDKREAFVVLLDELETCQKSLSAYLESKRKMFPRFYFVSDSTLLEILSNGSNPRAVQRQFQAGLFDGVDRLTFESESSVVATHIISKEGESVQLRTSVVATGPAEMWLSDLVQSMRETMRYEARRAAKEVHRMPVEEFLFGRPAQMALLGLQLKWTADVQSALYQSSLGKKGALKKVLVEYEAMLSSLVELTLSNDLSPVQRTSLETCITIFIHQKDVIEELIDKRVVDPKSFDWLKHCRFRWREDKGSLFVSICDNEFEYGYEYLGVKERLVMTPLTDVCYVALTQAVGMNCGGAPAGPAGTGKTETTKDLGNTLGRYVVVFNCSDQMDHHMMGRIFKGLAQAGFWGCFDEFNRINLDVLSVCAQQLNCVFTALKERKKNVVFTDGDSIPLNPEVGYFITMNPGYAGRQELPENLKALFRGVTMMAPDRRIIMKVKLAAAGFQDSDVISRKFDRLYTLCEQQLSKQPHYDFGLRNILSVLRTAGAAKRANPTTTEMVLMMKTLYDMNVSKFVSEDVRTFAALMHDVFPRVDSAPPSASDFCAALKETCNEVGWTYHADWADKCLQLYESSIVRHGIMVVGPSRSGKSTAIDAVARTLTRLGTKTSVWKMNPKSITAPQMFGRLDASTGDWTDGIFSQLWKKAARTSHAVWIVVDGPVDAVWIENLNTVLDDNKVLTLANGDRVRMMPTMRLVFEAENLNNASPATVSRAGVVFMSPSALGWRPILQSYIVGNGFSRVGEWTSELVEACLRALESVGGSTTAGSTTAGSKRSVPVQISHASMMESFIAYLDGLLARHADLAESLSQGGHAGSHVASHVASHAAGGRADHKSVGPNEIALHVKHVLVFCAAWGFGGALPRASRALFSARLRERLGDLIAFVPEQVSIHDFMYDVQSQSWKSWTALALGDGDDELSSPTASPPSSSSPTSTAGRDLTSITVWSPEETRCRYLIDLVLGAGKIPHIVGPPGTGKSTIVRHYCDQRRQTDGTQSRMFAFSAVTSPQMFYNSLDGCLEKRQGCNYGPVGGGSMLFVMDDVSMPQRNEWGDQVTNELMRQLFQLGGFYRLTKPIGEFKTVGDVSYVATSKLDDDLGVPNRLSGIMRTIYVDHPTEADILQIVDRIIAAFVSTPGRVLADGVVAQLQLLGKVAVKICSTLARTLAGPSSAAASASASASSQERFHYVFGMRQPCSIVRFLLSKLDSGAGSVAGSGAGGSNADPGNEDPANNGDRSSTLVRLFAHECRRELLDMIVSDADIRSVTAMIDTCIQEAFGSVPEPTYFSSFVAGDVGGEEGEREASGAPSARASPPTAPAAREYREVVGAGAKLAAQVERAMTKARQKPGVLVLFDDALRHILKVSRVLESDRRSVMLVGVGGSGKKSLAKVAAAVAGACFVHTPKGPAYGVSNFLDDLGNGFKRSGIKGEPVCFLMSDADVCDAVFLDYVNQQLSTGRIVGIFEKEDVDSIVAELRPAFKESNPGAVDAEDAIMDFFWDRVSRRFHFCFSFSPTGGVLARWTKQFPGLLSSCTVDWFHPWPTDALRSLANRFLPGYGDNVPDAVGQIHSMMMRLSIEYLEETGRQVHITPKSFLSFVGSISALYATKLAALRDARDSLSLGLEKMAAAKDQVDEMKVELEEKQVVLAQSKREIAALISEIDQSTQEATVERRKVQTIVARVTKKAKEIFQTKLEAERDLEAAKPALDAALEALNSITPKDINSLKALRNPPDVIKRIMDCVLILRHMRIGKVSWHEVKGLMVLEASYPEALKMMSDMGFLQTLLNFPKEEINDETVELLQPYFRSDDFNYESAKKASGNVAGLCNWAEAMCKYHVVARDVEPKIVRLKESEKELGVAKKEQEGAEREKDKVEAALRALEEKLEEANGDMGRVQEDADTTEMKLNNAVTLIESLGGEGARWKELKMDVDREERNLLGDCLLACTFTSYLGPIGVTHRERYLRATKQLCSELRIESSEAFHPVGFLTEPTDVLGWLEASLPADEVSVQNGALFASSFRTTRVPYVIDPQGQCVQWIQRMYPDAVSVPISSASFMDTLQSAIVRGVPLVVQNVDSHFGSTLDCVLDRELGGASASGPCYIKIGDKELEVAEGFQAVLTTRLANPSISPENFAKCTVIDFTVTGDGLEEQFLGFLISRDEAELDRKRQSLDDDVRRCEAKMKQLENDLLKRLSSHQGDILEDTHLIGVLADTKETTKRVAVQLKEASVTKRAISETCEKYRPCAKVAALLYFALCDFARLNHMYSTSLEQFLAWFDESIGSAASASTTNGRVANVLAELKRFVYLRAQYGMFECDKDAWRLLMAVVVTGAAAAGAPSAAASTASTAPSPSPAPPTASGAAAKDDIQIMRDILMMGKTPVKDRRRAVQWLSDEQWRNVLHLQQTGLFDNLLSGPQGLSGGAEAKWKAWVNLEEPEAAMPPNGTNSPTPATLHQLALVRALRPDRSKAATRKFVEQTLGPDFLASRAADLARVVEASGPDEPIICVISPGADPTSRIHDLARKFKTKCHDVSMGQGQEVVARKCLEIARQRGDWVCIQNAHLAGAFLKELADGNSSSGTTAGAGTGTGTGTGTNAGAGGSTDGPPGGSPTADLASPVDSGTETAATTASTTATTGFRLWITTEPTDEFPLGLLQRGTRITCEPPAGVHDALLAIVAGLGDDTLEEVKTPFWKPMLLSLICMHVLSQERKRFGPIGWVVGYEFSGMDLLSSLAIVSNHLYNCQRKAKARAASSSSAMMVTSGQHPSSAATAGSFSAAEIDWEALRYLISVIQYGGRIIDDRDQRLMDVLVKRFVSPDQFQGGTISLLDPKKHPKLHHLYRIRVDGQSMRDGLVSEVEALPATDIPEVFGLDGAAERVALEIAGRSMFASLEKVIVHGGSSAAPGGKHAKDAGESHDAKDNDEDSAVIDVQAITSEPLRAVFRMELAWLERPQSGPPADQRRRSRLQAAIPFKGRCLHLGAMSNPKALLNAVLQDFARKHSPLTVDELEIEWTVTKLTPAGIRDAPKDGLYVWGLVLEGGVVWDEQRSALKLAAASVRTVFPVVHVTAVEKSKRKRVPGKRIYSCPLFVDEGRKTAAFVDAVDLVIDGGLTGDELVQRGVALIVD